MLQADSFSVPRGTGRCAATGEPLEPGDCAVAALVDDGAELERLDYSEEGWNKGSRPGRLFGFWRYVVLHPDAKPDPLIDDTALLDLFEQLEGVSERRRVAFRFILALILIRKRILRHKSTLQRDDVNVLLVQTRGPDGWDPDAACIEVVDPDLDEVTIADVTEQLDMALRGAA